MVISWLSFIKKIWNFNINHIYSHTLEAINGKNWFSKNFFLTFSKVCFLVFWWLMWTGLVVWISVTHFWKALDLSYQLVVSKIGIKIPFTKQDFEKCKQNLSYGYFRISEKLLLIILGGLKILHNFWTKSANDLILVSIQLIFQFPESFGEWLCR